MSKPDRITRFTEAMKTVYGPFDTLSPDNANSWTFPDDPGAGGFHGRYLWTDAFGVVNFITLSKETGNAVHLSLAKRLVETVHDVLGRTRDGTKRLDGATDEEPLRGGLRIGKRDAKGNDGDGQYHHYLTLWMFALNRLSVATGETGWNDLGIQLARAIHARFMVHCLSGGMRMVWKISMDMKSVLVPSEGHLDAATGYAVYKLLQHTAARQGHREHVLQKEVDDYWGLMKRKGSLSPGSDFLDVGMGLWAAHLWKEESWAERFCDRALPVAGELLSTRLTRGRSSSSGAAEGRLAFREFGTVLGVGCWDVGESLRARAEGLLGFWERWLDEGEGEEELKPMSSVMYASGLIVGAFRRDYLEDG